MRRSSAKCVAAIASPPSEQTVIVFMLTALADAEANVRLGKKSRGAGGKRITRIAEKNRKRRNERRLRKINPERL